MADRIIYSTLCALENCTGAATAELQPFIEMASLWAAHLRGPGDFRGRILLLTNLPGLRVEGAEPLLVSVRAADRRQLFVERVRLYRSVPVQAGDQVMQLDLDALAVAPVEPLFRAIRPAALLAAPSGLSPLADEQAGCLMTARERCRYRIRGWYHRRGVSACMTACEGADWKALMRRWAAAIRARGRGRCIPAFGDQSFLNFLYLTGGMRVRKCPQHLIYHVRHPGLPLNGPQVAPAVVVHFPIPQKRQEMRRWSRL